MATTLEIIRGISQAAANGKPDGAHVEAYASDGRAREIGLSREEGDPLVDKRVMDGFGVSFYGNVLCLHYHSELTLRELHNLKDLEGEIESKLKDIVKFLKKEYKAVTGDALTLTSEGDVQARAEYISRVRAWVTAKKFYKIGGIPAVESVAAGSEDRLSDAVKNWLSLGKGGKQ
tara:strand:- start:703 stop:1227 length:525 start_codon:yes stop_codon:yes gene_type:complete